ncbi:amino acid ABC transporter permease [Pikeienuella piscinae]|uniref:Amino acid ABC transporter permease n=1 Tax=Pikeienuella piscinae TaxID=2748098 RepID=A0A7L5BSV2_9RHOB|nr:amino acid ABC transporter permease [Pikeienuella piscinae]QIE54435.1 amino acid ABC transporter permease [Pikeienuella piscinae]
MSETHAETAFARKAPVAFVAEGEIPASPPPMNAVGPVKWIRDNLFPGPVNAILTILSLIFIVFVAYEILPWLIDSSWSPAEMSLAGCRAEASGACFAVINERFPQFFFGFYPQDLYWRPSLAFGFLLLALWPVLFESAPRKLLFFSAIYPVLGYWLIWGGTIWGPLAVLAAPVVGWLIYTRLGGLCERLVGEAFGPLMTLIAAVLAVIVWGLFLVIPIDEALSAIAPIALQHVPSAKLGGFLLSLIIGVVGIAASLPFGIALALGRQSNLFIVKALSVGFIEAMRGVPLITLLFVASTLLNYFLPPGTNFDLILRVCIMVTFFASAYMAEVIRGGIAALPKGQYEAADAMGLTYWQSMRLIILPQALKISIPNIVSTFIGLFKDTTLVIVIGLLDPLGLSSAIRADANWNGVVWELYGFIALFFFIFCFGMSRYSQYLERKLRTDHR